ncbi:MAG: NAD-dependent epimerase/dehydratase family protein [Lachnospiraceae bacterium]|nr:NAD-dependent epimerase/dehydratase family protein [Lachnospiraceae bacterium]
MRKNILVIGGSYFAGRVFNILSSREDNFEIHTVNRGSHPLIGLPHVNQYKCDRHNPLELSRLVPQIVFDAVIDFCAYAANDIRSIMEALSGRIRQYIYISTSSVYDPSISRKKKEGDPILTNAKGNYIERYIDDKALLEEECIETAARLGISYTILRPAFLYGPYNYAPRESWYIQKIVKGEPIPITTDCLSRFSFLYVVDLAQALKTCVGNPNAQNEIFNLAGPEEITYDIFIRTLKELSDIPFTTEPYTVQEVLDLNLPLPFPLENNDLCDGSKAQEKLNLTYTPFREGMGKTFKIFKNVFTQ